MTTRAMNLRMDEREIADVKEIASVFNMSMTDVFKEAIREYVDKVKRDPFYRLTINVADADAQESAEILSALNDMTDDDLSIASSKRLTRSAEAGR